VAVGVVAGEAAGVDAARLALDPDPDPATKMGLGPMYGDEDQ
jgi:hypothetical protein